MPKKLLLLLFALSVVLVMSGCGKKEADVIKIGVAGPMTGDQSKMGQDFKNGVELAVEQVNAKGGVLGKKVVMVVEDDQHDPKQAVSAANKLVNEGVAGVIGHFNSNCSIPASRVYMDGGVVEITPATTNPKIRIPQRQPLISTIIPSIKLVMSDEECKSTPCWSQSLRNACRNSGGAM